MSHTPRTLALAAAGALTLIAAGCSTGPFATQGRFFQYHAPDNRVVAEYLTADTATCRVAVSPGSTAKLSGALLNVTA